ncbi:hypothetical protein [Nocardia tenerifensis]|nr:hypothetical protein [Nocardia tenerifensis]
MSELAGLRDDDARSSQLLGLAQRLRITPTGTALKYRSAPREGGVAYRALAWRHDRHLVHLHPVCSVRGCNHAATCQGFSRSLTHGLRRASTLDIRLP